MIDNSIRVILGQSEKEYQLWKTIRIFYMLRQTYLLFFYYYKFGLLYDNNNILKKKTLLYS